MSKTQAAPPSRQTARVTLTIATGPAGATLGGTTTVAAQNGVATFSNLNVSEAGAYILVASDGALTSNTSGSFNVIMPSPLVPTLGGVNVPSSAVAGKLTGKVPVIISNQGNRLEGQCHRQPLCRHNYEFQRQPGAGHEIDEKCFAEGGYRRPSALTSSRCRQRCRTELTTCWPKSSTHPA